MQTVFFTRPESFSYAASEISDIGLSALSLGRGVGLVRGEEDTAALIRRADPLFIRHLHPAEVRLDGVEQAAAWAAGQIERVRGRKIAVQTYDATNARLERPLRYGILDHPAFQGVESGPEGDIILSATSTEKGIYMGISAPEETITPRTAGIYRYGFEKDNLSRAEFKLTEVFDTLPLKLPASFKAVDLGAAPGGWTRVLLNKGGEVTAVDPAGLDESLENHPKVRHYRGLSQDYIREYGARDHFDLLVNDMRMDARMSVRVTGEAMEMLPAGALVIMTLKLPEKKSLKIAREGVALFREGCELLYARQLYHNRSEITCVGRKK